MDFQVSSLLKVIFDLSRKKSENAIKRQLAP